MNRLSAEQRAMVECLISTHVNNYSMFNENNREVFYRKWFAICDTLGIDYNRKEKPEVCMQVYPNDKFNIS